MADVNMKEVVDEATSEQGTDEAPPPKKDKDLLTLEGLMSVH